MPVLAQTQGSLQPRDGLEHVPLPQIHHTDPLARLNLAEGIMDGLGDLEPVFGHGAPRRERAQLGVAPTQPGSGGRRDAAIGAKACSEQIPLEGCHIPPQTLDGPCIVSRVVIGPTQDEMRPGLEADMPERAGQGQRTLAGDDGAVHLACHPVIGAQVGVDPPEPQGIAQRLGEGLGAAQVVEPPPRGFAQDSERVA